MMTTPKPTPFNSRTADKFVVRLPEGMRERVSAVAKVHHRSMNSEIIARLEMSLEQEAQAALIHVDAASLTGGEKQLIKAFRNMHGLHQKAILELMTVKPALTEVALPPQSRVA
ncbi:MULTISPECIES: Arc family DNA-binding protein [Pseudomonas syringae group]